MLSAPVHIPAITLSSLGTGLAAPDLIRDVVIDTLSARIAGSRVCSASPASTGVRSVRAHTCSRSTDSSWRAWPKVNSRNSVPRVVGA